MNNLIDRKVLVQYLIDNFTANWMFHDLINAISQVPNIDDNTWIPVAERLPENGEIILVTRKCRNEKRYAEQDEYYEDTGFESGADEDIIAWMPLPEPYMAD